LEVCQSFVSLTELELQIGDFIVELILLVEDVVGHILDVGDFLLIGPGLGMCRLQLLS
jgi:hypothetical protein